MIIADEKKVLTSAIGTKRIDLDSMIAQAEETQTKWQTFQVDNSDGNKFRLTRDLKLHYRPDNGKVREVDMTETAFSQLSSKVGVPGSYTKKCFQNGHEDLAIENFRTWLKDGNAGDMQVKEYDGISRAVLGSRFTEYNIAEVLKTVKSVTDGTDYVPNQAHMSTDDLHVRFIMPEPIYIPGSDDKNFAGFTVSSSDVGTGSLNMKFFLYRFACMNGIVVIRNGGEVFRQTHTQITSGTTEFAIRSAFKDIERLSKNAGPIIANAMGKNLKGYEMELIMERIRKEAHVSDAGMQKITELRDTQYGNSLWGVINSLTETAQEYDLTQRLQMETYAGNLLWAA